MATCRLDALLPSVDRSTKVIGLVGTAHGISHVYYFALPPLFPLIMTDLQVSFTELGLLMTIFSLVSGIGQTPVGFLVDRIGSRGVLTAGLILQALGIGLIGFAPSYIWIVGCVTLAGLAHSVYHPADYAILSATIGRQRLGRAFSLHAFGGNVGAAITPMIMVALAAFWGWRGAFIAVAVMGLSVAVILLSQASLLSPQRDMEPAADNRPAKPKKPKPGLREGLALLMSRPILMCFLFYVIMVTGTSGVRSFAVTVFVAVHQIPLAAANAALTGFMAGAAGGILIGGMIADRLGPRIMTAVIALCASAVLFFLLGSVSMPIFLVVAVLTAAGMLRGTLQATRDLLVHSVTPEGSHGKVFAFVSSGANIGGAISPLAFGAIMDHADPRFVFWAAAVMVLVALATFIGVKKVADGA